MNEWEWQLLEDKHPLEHLEISGVQVKTGDRVRLRPRQGGDVLDIALAGQNATIEAIEQDYEGKAHVCVVLDEDPGRDLGILRQPGHRFFFDPSEVEPLPGVEPKPQSAKPTILVAGIGNIFLGDDAFGVEVVRRLALQEMAGAVRVTDFGIRSFDLAYALQDGYDTVILVDAYAHGEAPGTVYVVEPDLQDLTSADAENSVVDTHGMNPMRVLRLAASMGALPKRIVLVGCEPQDLGGAEGKMGLSPAVASAIDEAAQRVASLVAQIEHEELPGSHP
jgi:hydrogenase maturation protease